MKRKKFVLIGLSALVFLGVSFFALMPPQTVTELPPLACERSAPPANSTMYVFNAMACHPDARVHFAVPVGRPEQLAISEWEIRKDGTRVRATGFAYDDRRGAFIYDPDTVERAPRCELETALLEAYLSHRAHLKLPGSGNVVEEVIAYLNTHPCGTYRMLPSSLP